MEALNELVKDDRRIQKFCGIRSVFNEMCLAESDTEEYKVTSSAFDKGFSRYMQSRTKIGGKFYPTYKNWKKHYSRWKKEGQNDTPVVEENVPVVNDDFSGLQDTFVKSLLEKPTESIGADNFDVLQLFAEAIKGNCKTFKKGDLEVTF